MKTVRKLVIFWFCFGPALFGASKIHDLKSIEVLIPGPPLAGISENGLGDKLSIVYGSHETRVVIYSKDNSVSASLSLAKDIFIRSVRWRDHNAWFIILDGRGSGKRIIGLAEFRP